MTDKEAEKLPMLQPSVRSFIHWEKECTLRLAASLRLRLHVNYAILGQDVYGQAFTQVQVAENATETDRQLAKARNKEILKQRTLFDMDKGLFISTLLSRMEHAVAANIQEHASYATITTQSDTRAFWNLIKTVMKEKYGKKEDYDRCKVVLDMIKQKGGETIPFPRTAFR